MEHSHLGSFRAKGLDSYYVIDDKPISITLVGIYPKSQAYKNIHEQFIDQACQHLRAMRDVIDMCPKLP